MTTQKLKVGSFQELLRTFESSNCESFLVNDGEALGIPSATCETAYQKGIYETPWIFSCCGQPASPFSRGTDIHLSLALSANTGVSLKFGIFHHSNGRLELHDDEFRVTFVSAGGCEILRRGSLDEPRAYDLSRNDELDFVTQFGLLIARDAHPNARLPRGGCLENLQLRCEDGLFSKMLSRWQYDTMRLTIDEGRFEISHSAQRVAKTGYQVDHVRGLGGLMTVLFSKRVRSSFDIELKRNADDSAAVVRARIEDADKALAFEIP